MDAMISAQFAAVKYQLMTVGAALKYLRMVPNYTGLGKEVSPSDQISSNMTRLS